MGKSSALLLIELDSQANPERVKILPGEVAGTLMRVAHGSAGSSFPGFNLPLPLRVLSSKTDINSLRQFVDIQRSTDASGSDVVRAFTNLFNEATRAVFTPSQSNQFRRSTRELVGWLKTDFAGSGPELENFRVLLDIVDKAQLELANFAEALANCICRLQTGLSRDEIIFFGDLLFGKTHLPKYTDALGSEGYWRAKELADRKSQGRPAFLDLEGGNTNNYPVADPRTGRLLNQYLLSLNPPPYDRSRVMPARRTKPAEQKLQKAKDAYTGQDCTISDKFPEPKLAFLGSTKLFSNNTTEAGCFYRYGLGDAETFKMSADLAGKMSGAIFTLAGDDLALPALGGRPSVGRTCRAIPGNRDNLALLIAYLEDEPDAQDPYVELFGTEAAKHDDPDFSASTEPVLEALEGKVTANPNQLVRLFVIASLDKANSQVSLSRSFTVREVMAAAEEWQAGAANCPPVTLLFVNKETRKPTPKQRTVPSPLEIASVLNKVWTSRQDGGFRADFNRAISVSDAYDIFVFPAHPPAAKVQFALGILLTRMRNLFVATGSLKATSDFRFLNEPTRWQVLKGTALIGIFLYQLGYRYDTFMKEPTYQLGRLLAYADSLHQQYCKHVRGGSMPTQLIGNALFATALEQPCFALARLAERLGPYQAWAKTFRNTNPEVKSGYEKTLLKLIGECSAHFIEQHEGSFVIRVDELPLRMSDVDKAKLLLGYLADHPKSENKDE